jgi:tRNA-uridine 2-sulfurtransferase
MPERVVIAMSGGVDSSVAAALLVEQGYEVIGVMLRLWSEPAPPALDGTVEAATNRCCSVESIHDARSVADKLGIPFYVINAEHPFKTNVVDFFIREYAAGRTPNPCLMCNRTIRFGHLLNYARSLGASYLATGHYARIRRGTGGRYQLWRGADRAKDQSYVLSVLGQADLAQALFPVGEYTKPQVRGLAVERGLPTASRADSQDLCFITDGDYRRFLADQAPEAVRPGPILDREGRTLGAHRGLPFYTIGQRSGLGIAASQPLYVLALDPGRNAVIVGSAAELGRSWLRAGPINWIAGEQPASPFQAEVQIRYHALPASATVTPLPDGHAEVRTALPLRDIAPGQAAVFYQDAVCLGGGVITESRMGGERSGDDTGPVA